MRDTWAKLLSESSFSLQGIIFPWHISYSPFYLQRLVFPQDEDYEGETHPSKGETTALKMGNLSGHYSRDWSEYVNVIGVISEPFAREFR